MAPDSRGITTFGACAPSDDHPHTVEHLTHPNWPRSPSGNIPAPRRPVPTGVGGHLGDDFQESGSLSR
jgi:hypothetical protein